MEFVAIAALLVLAYTYVGYPFIAFALSRLRPWHPSTSADYEPTISVCMAVHQGADSLRRKLEDLRTADYPADKLEVIVYSDGATDGSAEVAQEFAALDPRFRVIRSEQRQGKPTGLNALRAAARHEVMLMTDLRPVLERNCPRALTAPLADSNVVCVAGTLVLSGAAGSGAYWRYERFIRSCEARLGSLVGVSGAIYAIRREDMPELPTDLILDDMWIPLRASVEKKGRIVLSEQALAFDTAFEDGHEYQRKVRTLAGNFQLLARMPSLLFPLDNPVWFQLVSHKLMRLVCPLALAALFVSTAMLAATTGPDGGPWRALFGGQVVFYGLASLGGWAGTAGRIARTFVVLNAAAATGFWRFLRRSQGIAW